MVYVLGIKVKQKREIEKRVAVLNVVYRDGQKDISRRENSRLRKEQVQRCKEGMCLVYS